MGCGEHSNSRIVLSQMKFYERGYIISSEPISRTTTSKYFHESSMKSVRTDVIGTFWRAMMRELHCLNCSSQLTTVEVYPVIYLAYANSALNPLIYGGLNNNLRRRAATLLRKLCICCTDSNRISPTGKIFSSEANG